MKIRPGGALNDKIANVAPLVPGTETPAEVNVITPPALAYITKTYPSSRIIGVSKLSYPSYGQDALQSGAGQGPGRTTPTSMRRQPGKP